MSLNLGPWFQDFKVQHEELQHLLKDYVQLRKRWAILIKRGA